LLWGGIILLAMFFPTDTKKSFKIFAMSVGFCLHSPDKGWVKLGGVEVAEEQNELASCHLWICFAVIVGFARSSNDVQVKRT